MMDEKKHIDRLFQEKLKDFEVFPDAEVWKNIEKQLVKKKKRRVVPLWLRLGSAAAVLLLLISGGIWMFNSEKPTIELPDTNSIITDVDDQNEKDKLENSNELNLQKQQQNAAKRDEEIVIIPNSGRKNSVLKSTTEKNYAVAESSTKRRSLDEISNDKILKEANNTSQLENEEKKSVKEKLNDMNSIENTNTTLASNSGEEDIQKNQGKKDMNETLKENENNVALLEQNTDDKKWSVGSTIAPVYFNTLSKGSPIHSSLSNNEKNSKPSLSYGIKVNYKINDRLSLQSGVNSLDLAYQTEDVRALVTSTNSLTNETNINTNVEGVKIITSSASFSDFNSEVQAQGLAANGQGTLNNLSGDLNQSLSYVEIPMEAKYALLQKKIGVNIIGGVSTYFLYRNTVDIQNNNGSVTLGEASNLNDVNFSGNIGLDLDYKINKKLYINVSPMFKYQLNTFSKNDGDFKPYFLGVYTGLNFRF